MESITNDNARITICKHFFCSNCIETIIQTQEKCPLCRTYLPSAERALVKPGREISDSEENSLADLSETSSKLEALLTILEGI
jgi:SWI/SNF-related matrix-associated actin-dependent regulator of chromatin subfamily A3